MRSVELAEQCVALQARAEAALALSRAHAAAGFNVPVAHSPVSGLPWNAGVAAGMAVLDAERARKLYEAALAQEAGAAPPAVAAASAALASGTGGTEAAFAAALAAASCQLGAASGPAPVQPAVAEVRARAPPRDAHAREPVSPGQQAMLGPEVAGGAVDIPEVVMEERMDAAASDAPGVAAHIPALGPVTPGMAALSSPCSTAGVAPAAHGSESGQPAPSTRRTQERATSSQAASSAVSGPGATSPPGDVPGMESGVLCRTLILPEGVLAAREARVARVVVVGRMYGGVISKHEVVQMVTVHAGAGPEGVSFPFPNSPCVFQALLAN